MVMILGYVLTTALGGGRNLAMMIPMMLSVVASVTLAVYAFTRDKKKREGLEISYKQRISELRRKMESEHEQQRIYYFYNYPNPEKTLAIADDLEQPANSRQEEIRSGSRLWERRPTDHISCTCAWGSVPALPPSSTISVKLRKRKAHYSARPPAWRRIPPSVRCTLTIPLHLATDESENKKVKEKTEDQEGAERRPSR